MSIRPDPDQIWCVKYHHKIGYTLGEMRCRNNKIGVENYEKIYEQGVIFGQSLDVVDGGEIIEPIVHFPSSGFSPDYFQLGLFNFCSERLRDALAQPHDVIDYTPIDLRCDGVKAIAQKYQWMRVIAVQPGLDLVRSRYRTFDWGDPESGKSNIRINRINKLVLQEGFQPKTEIFYLAEPTLCLLATDSLAGRVLKADCTGLEFRHLDAPSFTSGAGPITVRTKRGTRQRE